MSNFNLAFSIVFVVALVGMVGTKLWLASRQIRHVVAHRKDVPPQFLQTIPLAAHQRAADYTVERTRLTMVEVVISAALLIVLTLLGGIQQIELAVSDWLGRGYVGQMALVAIVVAITSVVDLPFDYIRHFVIEEKFGFNRMTKKLFFLDLVKGIVLGAAIGLPILFVTLWLMNQAGALWWLWAWVLLVAFQMLVLILYPTFIAPLFNKFEPLKDEALRARIENLMSRTGFAAKGLFVMDGSRRSAHGNAYFTGFGAAKRIVFFDTLLARLSGNEIEAVLAHELGHFKRRHVIKRLSTNVTIRRLITWRRLKWPSSCASTASISLPESRASRVSKKTIRFAAPKPVKYALPCAERRLPSMTNKPFVANPVRDIRFSIRERNASSFSGSNLLNSGAINVGYRISTSIWNATSSTHAHSHHKAPAWFISHSVTNSTGRPIAAPSTMPFTRSRKKSFFVIRLKPNFSSITKCRM